jgi:adenylate cyclase class 2
MPFEIELKASVEDPRALEERISLLAPPAFSFEKDDCYWTAGGEREGHLRSDVRLRRERIVCPAGETEEKVLVTYKTKEIREGIEVNDEREFVVSDAAAFEDLLRRLGLKPGIRKHKQGRTWTLDAANVELCEVSGPRRSLGWFLEIEILVDNVDSSVEAAARQKLLGILEKVGVPRSCIEERLYSELLVQGKD